MATTTSHYSTFTPQIGTLTNSDGLFRPDAGLASSGFFVGQLDILPQLDLPGNAIAPLTGLEVLIDSASAGANVNNAILIQIFSASISYSDKNLTSGYLNVTTTPTSYTVGSSSLAGGVWKSGTNALFETGSAAITRISSASSATNKLKLSLYIAGGGQTISFKNLRVRLTYTPAVSPSTEFRRPTSTGSNTSPSGDVGFLSATNMFDGASGFAISSETGSILELVYPDFGVPTTATIIGYEVLASGSNLGSGSTPAYGELKINTQLGSGSTFGTLNTTTFEDGDEDVATSVGFGGTTNLQGLNLTPQQVNSGMKLRVEYSSSTGTIDTGSFRLIGGSNADLSPSLRVYFANTPTSSYSRLQLRNRVKATEDFAASDSVTFVLENNLSSTAYFNIEGKTIGDNKRQDIFNTASITNLVSCSVITETQHAGFIVNPSSTASFIFTPDASIDSESVEFIAANLLKYTPSDTTGSVFGVDLKLE